MMDFRSKKLIHANYKPHKVSLKKVLADFVASYLLVRIKKTK